MKDSARLRLVVCGGRNFRDVALLSKVLDAVDQKTGISELIEIGDRAGWLAAEWALSRSIKVTKLHGDRHSPTGRAALASLIVDGARPHLAISFAGGVTTAALCDLLGQRGVRVRMIAAAGEPL